MPGGHCTIGQQMSQTASSANGCSSWARGLSNPFNFPIFSRALMQRDVVRLPSPRDVLGLAGMPWDSSGLQHGSTCTRMYPAAITHLNRMYTYLSTPLRPVVLWRGSGTGCALGAWHHI